MLFRSADSNPTVNINLLIMVGSPGPKPDYRLLQLIRGHEEKRPSQPVLRAECVAWSLAQLAHETVQTPVHVQVRPAEIRAQHRLDLVP